MVRLIFDNKKVCVKAVENVHDSLKCVHIRLYWVWCACATFKLTESNSLKCVAEVMPKIFLEENCVETFIDSLSWELKVHFNKIRPIKLMNCMNWPMRLWLISYCVGNPLWHRAHNSVIKFEWKELRSFFAWKDNY